MRFWLSFLLLVFSTFPALSQDAQNRPRLILDADTANEIDDLYAIIRVLHQDRFQLIALNSAQWFHVESGPKTVFASQKINEDLLRLCGRKDIPALLGADIDFGRPWGGTDPRDSEAAQFLIKSARETKEGERLTVACIGATTNLATAIKLAPDIVPRLRVYVMGFRFDWSIKAWNKSEFNIRRDLNAADFLLNAEGLEMHVMDANLSFNFKFDREESTARQDKMGELGQYLTNRWKEKATNDKVRVMWDLALVLAMISPNLATEEMVDTPPENSRRQVWVYRTLDAKKMEEDFWHSCMPK
jgi:purine nucleosidase